ncbi:MAG: tRNA 2-thiouridine(34) synthase MnmA [Candidatus Promineifilaceae bacterium]|nr:tRNA 2-thiouridine(34) synthase MnmA [Candidatus Promineifilaceae bacterium]
MKGTFRNSNRDFSNTPNREQRVVVAMSGGVDSSVAAALLVAQGYDVVGMMMRLWNEPGDRQNVQFNRCCTPDQMRDARRIADQLSIPFYVLDVKEYFYETIVQLFIDEHLAGRTPNPCIECNRQIRFTYLLEQALSLGADCLATGHYARVRKVNDKFDLLKGVDYNKDQSYVLHVLNQDQLAKVRFPVGMYRKEEVRDLARQFQLPVAGKHDSQDLCFVADGNYRRFLEKNSDKAANPGSIVTDSGKVLGNHKGLSFYTIGQRKGLGISASQPLYVLNKDINTNSLVVGPREALGKRKLTAVGVNWIDGLQPEESKLLDIKIRYKAKPVKGFVSEGGSGQILVRFTESVFGITPGQGVVFYDDELCLGGGIIADSGPTEVAAPGSVAHKDQ